jgi:hypothetical protein
MSLSDIGYRLTSLLSRRKGIIDPRFVRGTVSWLLHRDGWITPVWTTVTYYSGDPNLVRFRNDLVIKLPKGQWQHDLPGLFRYELTAHIAEIRGDSLLYEIIEYSELARTASRGNFDRHPPRFCYGADHGGYGWTKAAWNYHQNKRRHS